MEHLEPTDPKTWEERRKWFEKVEQETRGECGSYLVSEQACALTADVQACFCSGAWVAVIVLSIAVVDAALRETEVCGFKGSTKDLIDYAYANPRLQKLRKRRNQLVHVGKNPGITTDQQWSEREKLEEEAKSAIELMFEAFYLSPSI